jgi:hypothetical protein
VTKLWRSSGSPSSLRGVARASSFFDTCTAGETPTVNFILVRENNCTRENPKKKRLHQGGESEKKTSKITLNTGATSQQELELRLL